MNAKRLIVGLGITMCVAAQDRPDWLRVARQIGGSGTAVEGRYVRLIPSKGWQPEPSPPVWLELRAGRVATTLRASIPVLRDVANAAQAALVETLPRGSVIRACNTLGLTSPQMHLRVVAHGSALQLATAFRAALQRLDPGAIGRIDVVGVVEADSFECEDGVVIRTNAGERINAGRLAPGLRRVGTTVRLVAQRTGLRHDRFHYYGSSGQWRSIARLERLTRSAPPPPRELPPMDEVARRAWRARCLRHARLVLSDPRLPDARLVSPFATGFEDIQSPGRAVSPYCERMLVTDRLFASNEHDRVDATLYCCEHERIYFLERDGNRFGPFDPDSNQERSPR